MASPNAGTGETRLLNVIAPSGSADAWAFGASAVGTLIERFTP